MNDNQFHMFAVRVVEDKDARGRQPDLYVGEPKKRMTLQGLFDAICETFSEEEAHAVARALNAATADLISSGKVERQGERRGARYRLQPGHRNDHHEETP